MYGKGVRPGRKIGHVTTWAATDLASTDAAARGRHAADYLQGVIERMSALVGVVMGSDSDWPTVSAGRRRGCWVSSGWPYEADVVSAHRMPGEMLTYGEQAAGRGLRVLIAGAGGAAHSAGDARRGHAAAGDRRTRAAGKYLDGMDSLLSIVQMPAGRAGGDRVDRGRPERRTSRLPGYWPLGTPGRTQRGCVRRCWTFQSNLRDQAHAKGAALRVARRGRYRRVGCVTVSGNKDFDLFQIINEDHEALREVARDVAR